MYPDEVMPMHEGRMLPSITFRQSDLPQVLEWEVNNNYYLIVKVEMTGKRTMKNLDAPNSDRNKIEGDFKILSVKALGREPLDLRKAEQKDWEETVAKALSGELK